MRCAQSFYSGIARVITVLWHYLCRQKGYEDVVSWPSDFLRLYADGAGGYRVWKVD